MTPSTIAAAKLAIDAPQRLPTAIATLESALPQSDDPRITTLRTIAAFVGKIEPSSPQLATQIAAYVEHVVSGSEPAIAQLVGAHIADDAASLPNAPPSNAPAAVAAEDVAPPALPVVALAQIVERAANIAASFKEQLFSLVNGAAPAGVGTASDDLIPAARSALAAVTSVQLATAQALAADPQTIAFSIPMWLGSGFAQAQLALDRDAPDSTPSAPLDGDNFHIAFILDTKNLGTVTVDLRTVGREFSLTVRTETLRTAQRFGDELSRLTDRLSSLRYTPKSVEAVVVGSAPAAAGPMPSIVTDPSPSSNPKAPVNERG